MFPSISANHLATRMITDPVASFQTEQPQPPVKSVERAVLEARLVMLALAAAGFVLGACCALRLA